MNPDERERARRLYTPPASDLLKDLTDLGGMAWLGSLPRSSEALQPQDASNWLPTCTALRVS
jgi:hypothetical protein